MNRNRLLLFILLGVLCGFVSAQGSNLLKYDIKRVIPSSPEAAALGKYGEIPVNSNTGIPQIDIPLYQIQGQDLNIPISISYHHSGFKPAEVSSAVGLGWSLNAGGVITRNTVGYPDEASNGYYGSLAYYENNVKNTTCVDFNGAACAWRLKAINGEIDLEPDEFFFNFNGKSGRFMINQDREIACFPEQNLKVTIDSDYTCWTITDTDGMCYVFNQRENCTSRYGYNFASAWYLSEVYNTRGTEVCYFEYLSNPTRWTEPTSTLARQYPVQANSLYREECDVPQSSITQTEVQQTNTVRLSKIRFPKQALEVQLSYANDRKDVIAGSQLRLTNLSVISNSTTIRNFTFGNDSYFGESAQANYQEKRLKLTSVRETLSQAIHAFDYTESGALPRYVSADTDHWGYYNGKSNSSLIPPMDSKYSNTHPNVSSLNADKTANEWSTQICMLSKITYPTKGYTSFLWESNIVSYPSISKEVQEHVSASCSGGTFTMTAHESALANALQLNHMDDTAMPVNINISKFHIRAPTSVSVAISKGATASGYCAAYIYKVNDIAEDPGLYLPPTDLFNSPNSTYLTNNSTVQLGTGGYLLIAIVSKRSKPSMSISASLNFEQTEVLRHLDYPAGGLRIARIESNDDVNVGNTLVKTYKYKTDFVIPQRPDEPLGYERSSAKLFLNPYEGNYSNYAYIDQCSNTLIRTSYLVDYFGELPRNVGYHVGYSEVAEIIGGNSEGGFTVTTYKNEEDRDSRNLVLSRKSYDHLSQPVHAVENTYTQSAFKQIQTKVLNIRLAKMNKVGTVVVFYRPDFRETLPTRINSTWYGISQQKEKTFADAAAVETITNYGYDGLLNVSGKHIFPTLKTYTNSNGALIVEKTRYSLDFSTPNSWIAGLNNRNIIVPVEQQTLTDHTVTSGIYTQYNQTGEATGVYVRDLSNTGSQGIDDSGNLTANSCYVNYANLEWNTAGKLVTETIKGNRSTAYIWGYNNTLPVVKIEGLVAADIPSSISSGISNYALSVGTNQTEILNSITAVRNLLAGIATSKPYLATIYTYMPNVGITSETQPNGVTLYYNYDTAGRLSEVYLFEGGKKVIQSLTYNFKNQ